MQKVVTHFFKTCLLMSGLLLLLWPAMAFADAYEIGLRLYTQGDYAMASRYFLEAAGQSTDNPNAHYYLADSYLKLNRYAEAQAEYQKILAIAPDTQAARLSRIGLSHLREYLNTSQSDRWRHTSTTRAEGVDKYMGGPIEGEDYLDNITEGGRLVRWSLLKMPLKVYIESAPQGIHNFQPGFVSQVRRALDIWAGALNHQLSFAPVSSPDQADIRVTWTDSIDTQGHSGDGGTSYTAGLMIPHISNDQIDYMEVKIATFDIEGNPQDTGTIYAVAIHELGHSLGLLGHSDSATDIMYAKNQRITTPSARDLNTLRRLYSAVADINNLPPKAHDADPERQAELSAKLDASIIKLEVQAKKTGMALNWLNLGVGYFQKAKDVQSNGGGDPKAWYQKSLSATNQAIQLEPKDPRAYHKRSLVYQGLNNYNNALQDIQHAITLDRSEPEYYKLQAWYFAKLGQTGQARSSLDTFLLYRPSEATSSEVKQIQDQLSANQKGGSG